MAVSGRNSGLSYGKYPWLSVFTLGPGRRKVGEDALETRAFWLAGLRGAIGHHNHSGSYYRQLNLPAPGRRRRIFAVIN